MVFETRKDLSSIFLDPRAINDLLGAVRQLKQSGCLKTLSVCQKPQDVFIRNGLLKVTVTRNTNLPLKLNKTFVFIDSLLQNAF
jgi:hypothetical protein